MDEVKHFFESVKRTVPDASRREAELPEGAKILKNPVGVAPGVVVEDGDTTYILLPGPPGEMKGMFQEGVVPYLDSRFGSQGVVTSYRYGVYDIREIDLENTLMDLIKNQSNPTIALLIKKGDVYKRQEYDNTVTQEAEKEAEKETSDDNDVYRDELLERAVNLVMESGQASVSMLQRRFRIGYTRAARLVDTMEDLKIVGPSMGSKAREILMSPEQAKARYFSDSNDEQ